MFGDSDEIRQAAPIILATVGLAHDLGNPPFGHQGEQAIARWYAINGALFEDVGNTGDTTGFKPVPAEHRTDFTKFDGNAQGFRLVSQLQNTSGPAGLDLTAATLAAMMKYPVASSNADGATVARKKHGYFASDVNTVKWVQEETGLGDGQRHPLTWIMEASDDIAYSVLDVEDAIKKGLVAAEDFLASLRGGFGLADLGGLIEQLTGDFRKADTAGYSLSRVREIKATYLRTRLIERLVSGATNTYLDDASTILAYDRTAALLDCGSEESKLCSTLKDFARAHAYQSPQVLELEHKGSIVIETLMDFMWESISKRKRFAEPSSRRTTPRAAYVYSLISDSYRWHFEHGPSHDLPLRYRELQLLSDMISGMTDGYALDLLERITSSART